MSVTSRSRGALLGRRAGRVEELEMIEPLQIEAQHPARAVHLKGVRVPAADAEPRRLERADAAVLESQQRDEGIVDRHDRGRRCATSAIALGDRTVEIQRGVEEVRQEIVGDAGSGLRADPSSSAFARRVRAPLLPVGGVVVEDRPEAPGVDQLPRVGDRRHPAVVEPHHRRHRARGVGHRLRVGERQRQGFSHRTILPAWAAAIAASACK